MLALQAEATSGLDALRHAVDRLAAEEVVDPGLGDELAALRREMDRLEYEFSRRLGRFEKVRDFAIDGAATLVSWLRQRCNLSASDASQRALIARNLHELPGASELFRAGTIGLRHAGVLARTVAEVGKDAARLAGDTLLEAAQRLDPDRLRLVTRHLRHCVDPDGALAEAIRNHERRYLHVSTTLDGVCMVDGLLDAEGGVLVRSAIEALCKPFPGDNRTAAERRADALVELATRQLQAGKLPTAGGQRPHLTVTAPAATLAGQAGAPAGELAWLQTIPAESVRRIACDASLTEITLGPNGEAVAVGRKRPTVPAAVRRAVLARYKTCVLGECDRPPEWTDMHHRVPVEEHGPTRVDNLVPLCRPHHRLVHEGGWTLTVGPDGRVEARPP